MSIYDTLRKLRLGNSAVATLTYSEGTSVFVHNETEIEAALSGTAVVEAFSELIATPGLQAHDQWGNNVLEELRDNELLDEYERDFTFAKFLNNTIRDNFYDLDMIESSTEKYDYKRGFCTLTATVEVPVSNLLESAPFLTGWEVSIRTDTGLLTLNH